MKNMKGKGYEIKAAGPKSAEILIYEDVGEGFFGGVTAKQFANDLKSMGKIDLINVRINSPGGSVSDGVAIHNSLARHPARIVVDIDGLAASIASVIAMAGNEIRMAENALFMMHDPWAMVAGNSTELRNKADLLDKAGETLLTTYTNRSNVDSDTIESMMAAETWLTAAEALELGLVDEITNEMKMAAHFDLSMFKNAPEPMQAGTGNNPDLQSNLQIRHKIARCSRTCKGF